MVLAVVGVTLGAFSPPSIRPRLVVREQPKPMRLLLLAHTACRAALGDRLVHAPPEPQDHFDG